MSRLFEQKLVPLNLFKVGLIIKMSPGYHTKNPYYVEVIFFNRFADQGETIMITSIPKEHKCNMIIGSNWEYHHRRMEIIGSKEQFENLLHNQPLD